MDQAVLLERLMAHRTVGRIPREELAWVAAHGTLRRFAPGMVVTASAGPVEGLFIVLDGHLSIHVDRGAGPRKVMEWRGGDVTGMLPFSRLKSPPGNVIAEVPTEVVMVASADLREMTRNCYELTAVLVHVMLDRVRVFRSSELLDEKMISLGRLAAGLAHELNNPASAVARSAETLRAELLTLHDTMKGFCALNLSDAQCAAVVAVRDAGSASGAPRRSPIEVADRQDALAEWLEAGSGVDVDALAESALDVSELRRLGAMVGAVPLPAVLAYLASSLTVHRLATEIETAASRIHSLVTAIKGFTYMDQHTSPQPVAIGQGLSDTLTVMRAKARSRAVDVRLDVAPDLPTVEGYGGELNQVWANLVDNAIDAAPGGRVDVLAHATQRHVVVRVIDNGPGIPPDILARIFDPFFTTKPVGQGTGLGLDIARRIIQRHQGELDVETGSGGTAFRVSLPLSPARH